MRLPRDYKSVLLRTTRVGEGGRVCKSHVTHIARPCPSAAGDYVDYRMIRTPPAPPSLPPWCYTGPEVEDNRSEERPPVSSQRKGVIFPLSPEVQVWPFRELMLRWTKRHVMKWTRRRLVCTLVEAETEGFENNLGPTILYLHHPSSV